MINLARNVNHIGGIMQSCSFSGGGEIQILIDVTQDKNTFLELTDSECNTISGGNTTGVLLVGQGSGVGR